MELEKAKELKKKLNEGLPSMLYKSRPIDREFYGRFELAIELLSSIEDLKEYDGAAVLHTVKITLQSILNVYGTALQENANIDQVPAN